MLDDMKSLLALRYGDRWLNSINNQNGFAEDLTIPEKDSMRISRKYGLVGRGMFVSTETEIVARYEVIKPVSHALRSGRHLLRLVGLPGFRKHRLHSARDRRR